ncbi:MAG: hypothetical protein L7T19_04725 [Pseudomonadales bacterium]|nr:hypothetical protein [Pseudomonadales bacterium]
MAIDMADLSRLIHMFQSSDWNELHVETGGLQLFLSKDPNARLTPRGSLPAVESVPGPALADLNPTAPSEESTAVAVQPGDVPDTWKPIVSPTIGSFYRSPKPGAAPFVEVGEAIAEGSDICLIEVMKLFTTVQVEFAGTVRKVCVEDTELVEAGQVLFYIELS